MTDDSYASTPEERDLYHAALAKRPDKRLLGGVFKALAALQAEKGKAGEATEPPAADASAAATKPQPHDVAQINLNTELKAAALRDFLQNRVGRRVTRPDDMAEQIRLRRIAAERND